MRWDDLQLLRWIDELEQTTVYIGNVAGTGDGISAKNHDVLPCHGHWSPSDDQIRHRPL